MVGRELGATYPQRNSKIGDVVLEAKNIVAEGVKMYLSPSEPVRYSALAALSAQADLS